MKKADWERLLEEQRSSGLTMAAFCRERGINRKTLSFQKSTLKRGTFVEVGEKPRVELVLPKGIVLRVSLGDLKGVLEVLDA
jgi:hypothetical protein